MSQALFVELRPSEGERRSLGDGTTVGREDCDVILDDEGVSRRHAVIRLTDSGLVIEDLGSSNGTFVNGERIEKARSLSPGDEVRLGDTEWRFERVGAAETALRAPPEPLAQPERGGGPASQVREEQRGDVPLPPDAGASAVRPVLARAPDTPPQFATGARQRPARGSAARSTAASTFCFAVILATAIALAIYFGVR